jgi:hypothetical protein
MPQGALEAHPLCAQNGALGAEAIPQGWLEKLAMRDLITEMADSLGSFSESKFPTI